MPSPKSRAIIAAAGSAKTQFILDQVLAHPERRALITTYTTENLGQIESRLLKANGGSLPGHVTIMSWFSFIVNQCIRPYQRTVFGEANYVAAFNFVGKRNMYAAKSDPLQYFLDSSRDVYRDGAADLACEIETRSGNLPTARLAGMFDDIYIDELQDLSGWDLDLLEHLFRSDVRVVAVGDPRQQTFSTNNSFKNKASKGAGLVSWIEARPTLCSLEYKTHCHRSNQAICDFADNLYPDLPRTESKNDESTGHDGIFEVPRAGVMQYMKRYNPVVLRFDRRADTLDLPAKNVGLSKGSTYDRVLIFPTKSWSAYFAKGDLAKVSSKEKFYVAVTRARFSVAYVVG